MPRRWIDSVIRSVQLRRAAPRDVARGCLAVALFAAVSCAPSAEPVSTSGEHDGLAVEAQVTSTGSSIAVDAIVRNDREEPIHLVPDQCGRIVDVDLERTSFLPEGKRWDGSIQAVKEIALRDQRIRREPGLLCAAAGRRPLGGHAGMSSSREADHPRAERHDRRTLGAPVRHVADAQGGRLRFRPGVAGGDRGSGSERDGVLRHRVLQRRGRGPGGTGGPRGARAVGGARPRPHRAGKGTEPRRVVRPAAR